MQINQHICQRVNKPRTRWGLLGGHKFGGMKSGVSMFRSSTVSRARFGCSVEYNVCYVLHFVTAIILRYTKNIYKICNCQPHSLKANFLTNTLVKFAFRSINIWKSYCQNTKGSRFYETRYTL